jgi:hypothetical protein
MSTSRTPQALLAELLAGYEKRFGELEAAAPRLEAQRTLTRRFLTHRARGSVAELERVLHRTLAVEGTSDAHEAMLRDLEHFRSSLRPSLSTLTRTFVVLGIALVAQVLGRLPLIPIVTGPNRKPALGSLSEAVDVDPGHVAKAISDLLGSPLSTICGAVATLSAAVFLVLGPTIPAFRSARELVSRSDPGGESIQTLERLVFAATPGASAPSRLRIDRLICWSLVTFFISLGAAWYEAYLRGLVRGTPSVLYALRTEGSPRAIFRTDHPTMLGLGGLALIAGGAVLGLRLSRHVTRSRLRRIVRGPKSWRARVSTVGSFVVAAPALLFSGFFAFEFPGLHRYHDPFLMAQTVRTRLSTLAAQPVIPLAMSCRPQPCTIVKARISLGQSRFGDPFAAAAAGTDVMVRPSLPSLSTFRTTPVSERSVRRSLGMSRLVFEGSARLPLRRVKVKRSELAELMPLSTTVPVGREKTFTTADPAVSDALRRYPGFLAAAPPHPRRDGSIAFRMYNVRVWAIVLSDVDLKSLLADLEQRRVSSLASLELTVRAGDRTTQVIHLPFALRA